jgi:DNA transposition AAA+ family ATPase
MDEARFLNGQDRGVTVDRLVQEARKGARMLRDDEVLTPARRDEVLGEIRAYIERHKVPLERIGLQLDCSASVISQVLSGTYKADPGKHVRALAQWVDQQSDKAEAVRPRGFVQTAIAKRLYTVAKYVQKYNSIGLAYGPAGVGKTITLKALQAEIPASIYASMRTGCERPLAVIEAIGTAARAGASSNSMRGWFSRLEQILKDSNRLILIDEVHKLVGYGRDASLHMLRDLHDATGCPMLWVGTSDVVTYIQTGQAKGKEPLDQLSSRIAPWCDLAEGTAARGGGKPLFSLDDIRKVFASDGLRIAPDGIEYLRKLSNVHGGGGLRACVKLVELAASIARGDAITAAMLDEAHTLRSGSEVAALRRSQMRLEDDRTAERKVG